MKKLFILFFMSFVLIGCGEANTTNNTVKITDQGSGAEATMKKIEARKQKDLEAKQKEIEEMEDIQKKIEEFYK